MKLAVAVAASVALALAVPASAAQAPTIVADPSILGVRTPLQLSGTVPNGQPGEKVELEGRGCRESFFRVMFGTTTRAGGAWSYEATIGLGYVRTNTWFRAAWRGARSEPILVRRRASVSLQRVPGRGGLFRAALSRALVRVEGKPIRLERLTHGGWALVRTAKLREVSATAAHAHFRVRTRGLQLRAVVAGAVVQPCYLGGVSPMVRS